MSAEPSLSQSVELDRHPLFVRWSDPVTGVVSYVLRNVYAPLQRAVYFVTPTIRGSGKYLWFYGFHPPYRKAQLGVVALTTPHTHGDARSENPADFGRMIPGAHVHGNPLVTPDGDAAWVPIEDGVSHVSASGSIEEMFRLPADLINNRYLFRLCTDLTISADGRHFLLDSQIGNRWLISLADVKTGDVRPLRWFGSNHHHSIFSLHDPELFMVNIGHWIDPITGDKLQMNVRTWLMDTKLTRYEPLDGGLWFGQNSMSCHEWWTTAGAVNWCDYRDGIYEMDLSTRQKSVIWPRPLVHGQVDLSGRFYCGDQNPYQWNERSPCSVWFFDRELNKEVAIVSKMPAQPLPWRDFRSYHIDPHPHFSDDGRWVIYTTTALGTVSVALCDVQSARAALGAG